MKSAVLLATLTLLIFGLGITAAAYEGGTKTVATMTHPEKGEVQFGPIVVIPHDALTPSKLVTGLLRRLPEPTLSVERIRLEKPGQSLGTKAVVLFQRER
jgi:hypothetical protein